MAIYLSYSRHALTSDLTTSIQFALINKTRRQCVVDKSKTSNKAINVSISENFCATAACCFYCCCYFCFVCYFQMTFTVSKMVIVTRVIPISMCAHRSCVKRHNIPTEKTVHIQIHRFPSIECGYDNMLSLKWSDLVLFRKWTKFRLCYLYMLILYSNRFKRFAILLHEYRKRWYDKPLLRKLISHAQLKSAENKTNRAIHIEWFLSYDGIEHMSLFS